MEWREPSLEIQWTAEAFPLYRQLKIHHRLPWRANTSSSYLVAIASEHDRHVFWKIKYLLGRTELIVGYGSADDDRGVPRQNYEATSNITRFYRSNWKVRYIKTTILGQIRDQASWIIDKVREAVIHASTWHARSYDMSTIEQAWDELCRFVKRKLFSSTFIFKAAVLAIKGTMGSTVSGKTQNIMWLNVFSNSRLSTCHR